MTAYYNEFDPKAAQWLRNLIAEGFLPKGDVDERSIVDVRSSDLAGYTQCHFFAGIGGWSLALQLAGWESTRPVWTGSCPCQPFSSAGNQKGKLDERHLWPVWFSLIRECRPPTIFGEQVATAIAHGWLDDVYQGLEAEGYACGSAVLPACSVGAPHKRDRLWFVADTQGAKFQNSMSSRTGGDGIAGHDSDLAYANGDGCSQGRQRITKAGRDGAIGNGGTLADSECIRSQGQRELGQSLRTATSREGQADRVVHDRTGHWESGQWINCPDGKARLVEPSIPLLAHGVSNRVVRIRAYGNAIVPKVAAEFIGAYMEARAA